MDSAVRELAVAGPVLDPRLSPAGDLVAYVRGGALRVMDVADPASDRALVAEEGVSWGVAEFVAAEEMNRFRGHWWAPDGSRVLAAPAPRKPNATRPTRQAALRSSSSAALAVVEEADTADWEEF